MSDNDRTAYAEATDADETETSRTFGGLGIGAWLLVLLGTVYFVTLYPYDVSPVVYAVEILVKLWVVYLLVAVPTLGGRATMERITELAARAGRSYQRTVGSLFGGEG